MHNGKQKFLLLIEFSVYSLSISYICNALPLIVILVIDILVRSLKLATSLLVHVASVNEKGKTNVIFIANLIYFFEESSP